MLPKLSVKRPEKTASSPTSSPELEKSRLRTASKGGGNIMRHALSVLAAAILGLTTAAFALGQQTTTVTKTVQNPDGTYTVIEYPVKKEIKIQLSPVTIKTGKGIATILRDDDGTRIKLNLTEIPSDVTALNLYAIDDTGAVTPIGPIAITNGAGTLTASAPLTKFMLVASRSEERRVG